MEKETEIDIRSLMAMMQGIDDPVKHGFFAGEITNQSKNQKTISRLENRIKELEKKVSE